MTRSANRVVRRFAAALAAAFAFAGATAAAAPAVVNTFADPAAITINDLSDATPYPSSIPVNGLTGSVQKATVTLHGFSHTCPWDVSALLMGPSGADSILFARVGFGMACPDSVNADLTFDQAAGSDIPYPPVTGTYKPTKGTPDPVFTPPAPVGPYPVSLDEFTGTAPNGTWNLFVRDESAADTGSISGGWSLTLTTPDQPAAPPAPPPTCRSEQATIVGTNGADQITGTPGANVIVALGGNDQVSGLAGNDLICGGKGNDTLKGGAGNDQLSGQKGNDKLYGQKGNDKLSGKAGNDTLKGGAGKDILKGGAGKDKPVQ